MDQNLLHPKDLAIRDFTYELPPGSIAFRPLPERSKSKLLVWKQGQIIQDNYINISDHLPEGALMILNDTRVIPARILFEKATGGLVEIFCLETYNDHYSYGLQRTGSTTWKCMIGGAGKWKSGPLLKELKLHGTPILLSVQLVEKLQDVYIVHFSWMPSENTFSEILNVAGEIPLPPYIKRNVEQQDAERYQTVYANSEGSVAAPTAGLHFTNEIFDSLNRKQINILPLTLHVSAGTFKPVKVASMKDHTMHSEWIEVSSKAIHKILIHRKNIIAVGTTSLRIIESLYWMGVKCLMNQDIEIEALAINQFEVYDHPLVALTETIERALISLLKWMKQHLMDRLRIPTQIMIAPGYKFRIVNALVTNFHQPESTLLLLVAAIAGDQWKTIYQYALKNDFRFLSYGDGSLLYI